MTYVKLSSKHKGMQIDAFNNATLYIYESAIDGRVVIEIETRLGSNDKRKPKIHHNKSGIPQLKIMLNESILHDEPAAVKKKSPNK